MLCHSIEIITTEQNVLDCYDISTLLKLNFDSINASYYFNVINTYTLNAFIEIISIKQNVLDCRGIKFVIILYVWYMYRIISLLFTPIHDFSRSFKTCIMSVTTDILLLKVITQLLSMPYKILNFMILKYISALFSYKIWIE